MLPGMDILRAWLGATGAGPISCLLGVASLQSEHANV